MPTSTRDPASTFGLQSNRKPVSKKIVFLAAYNYIQYRLRRGEYAIGYPFSVMGAAFDGSIPDYYVRQLQFGDLVFIATYNWRGAWPMMYLSACQMTHVAMYVGDGLIFHQTTGGPKRDTLSDLFNSDMRFLPVQLGWLPNPQGGESFVEHVETHAARHAYDWKSVWILAR
jgi:cell wall-associated NlpC family hydrolase